MFNKIRIWLIEMLGGIDKPGPPKCVTSSELPQIPDDTFWSSVFYGKFLEAFKTSTPNRDSTAPPREGCRHLKGGHRRLGTTRDYNLMDHTYIDGMRVIKCLNHCGAKWTKDSPDWDKALEMMEESTNTRSASERPIK